MKSLQESLLDNDDELFKNTNIEAIIENSVKKLPIKPNWPSASAGDLLSIYEIELAWLRFYDVIIGNMDEFDDFKIRLFLKLFQYWLPTALVEEPSKYYNSLSSTPEEDEELKNETVNFLSKSEYKSLQHFIQFVLNKDKITYNDLRDLADEIFGEDFIEFSEGCYYDPYSKKISKYLNDALIKIGFGDLMKWAKNELNMRI